MLPWVGGENVDILFLGDYPRWEDAQRGTFSGDAGATFRRLISLVKSRYPKQHPIQKLTMKFGYALQCGIADRESKIKPTTTDATLCSWIRNQNLSDTKPKLIVPMGKLATQAIGIPEKNFENVRGKLHETTIEDTTYLVYPVFLPAQVYVNNGVTKIFLNDLENVFTHATQGEVNKGSILEEIREYEYPKTLSEIKELSERIISHKGLKYPLAVDTETNSLFAHLPIFKCIAFSVAWEKRKSAAWLMNHKHNTSVDPLLWWKTLPYVFNILMCEKPKIAHNFQFDLRVFRHLVRCVKMLCELVPGYKEFFEQECHHTVEEIEQADGIRNVAWDTMIAEHSLEEDKKGFYSLKSIIRKYEPLFLGYEKALKKSEYGKELRTLADFMEYVERLDTTVELRRETEKFDAWIEAFTPKEAKYLKVPDRIYEFLDGVTEFEDAAKKIVKSKGKGIWQREVRKWFKVNVEGEDPKEEWKQFTKSYESAMEYKDLLKGAPAYVQEFVWYVWFKKESKRDHLKATVKLIANQMKEAMEREKEDINYENFDADDLLVYAAIDTDMTLSSASEQLQALVAEEKRAPSINYNTGQKKATSVSAMKKLSNPLCVALSKIVDIGVNLDYERLEYLEKTYTQQTEEMEEKIFELADVPGKELGGVEINLNSTPHVANLLMHAGHELNERTDTGQLRVTKDILKRIGGELPEAILLYRESLKARDTFLKNFRDYAEHDGRIHPSFHQIGTATYRLSSSRPNFQNIPKMLAGHNIKSCLIPTHPDWCIVNIDASGAEVKTLTAYLAQLTGEHRGQELIYEMNNDPKFDMHSKFCSYIFGGEFGLDVSTPELWQKAYEWVRENKDDIEAVAKARGKTKAVVFGTLYGQTEYGLSNLLGISVDEAKFIISQFFAADPSISDYVQWSQRFVRDHGFISTILGRRRRFLLARLDRKQLRRSMRQGTNFLIQSLTVDIFNHLLSNFIPVLMNELGGRPLMQVHDALVMEMPKKRLPEAVDIMKEHFSEKVQRDFPWFPVWFKCDVDAGDNYGEMKPAYKYIQEKGLRETMPEVAEEERDEVDVRLKTEEDPDEAHLARDIIFEH